MNERKCRNAERKKRFKENHPEAEAQQKEKERQRDRLLRFHIVRNHLYGYGFPEFIDQDSNAFARVRAEYEATLDEPVEKVEVIL